MMLSVNDARQFISEIWQLIVDREVRSVATPPTATEDWVAGCVQITGNWRGQVIIEMPISLARKLTMVMMSLPAPADVTPELFEDALGELVNMFAGNVRAVMPPPTYLSLPVVGSSSSFDIQGVNYRRLIELGFETCGDVFGVRVSQVELEAKPPTWKPSPTPTRIRPPAPRTDGSSILSIKDIVLVETQ
jgi:chemotaxis protein CheX